MCLEDSFWMTCVQMCPCSPDVQEIPLYQFLLCCQPKKSEQKKDEQKNLMLCQTYSMRVIIMSNHIPDLLFLLSVLFPHEAPKITKEDIITCVHVSEIITLLVMFHILETISECNYCSLMNRD